MGLRAKFVCSQITKTASGDELVQLNAVYGTSDENKMWSRFTPSGQLTMTISNPDAQGQLVAGKEYFLDISPAVAQ